MQAACAAQNEELTGDADRRWNYPQAMSQELLKVAEHCLPLAMVLFDDLLVVLESDLRSEVADGSPLQRVTRPKNLEPKFELVTLSGGLSLFDHIIEKYLHN